jgi:hypothetical protein
MSDLDAVDQFFADERMVEGRPPRMLFVLQRVPRSPLQPRGIADGKFVGYWCLTNVAGLSCGSSLRSKLPSPARPSDVLLGER